MVDVCFYFQVHQPYRLRKYSVFEIGMNHDYFDDVKNKAIIEKVANKCYIPMNKLLLDLLRRYPQFKISFSFSGVVLEQLSKYAPEALDTFKELVKTGRVEVLSETYFHSLAYLYSKGEFRYQVRLHKELIKSIFKVEPKVFRNTELIYNNELAKDLEIMGYKGIITEGADQVLGWRSPNFLYKAKNSNIKLLLKNYKLSDDIAFRFSDKNWVEYPLTTEKYVMWINNINGNGNVVNLFMDYETFGEHQWEDTGIFGFMQHLPAAVLSNPDNNFVTPSEALGKYDAVGELDVPYFISWADEQRDLSAWVGNKIQASASHKVYELEKQVKLSGDSRIIEDWRRLTTSDHFYYMCTKYFNDGDVHKYFNPYDTPYDAYMILMNVLNDLKKRVEQSQTARKREVLAE